jgi:hypothetical protein
MIELEKLYNFYFGHFLIRPSHQWEILVYREVPKILQNSKPVPRTPPLSSSSSSTCSSALLCLPLPPAVLRPWPPLCRRRRATSCFSSFHASSSPQFRLYSPPCCPPPRTPRHTEPSAGRHALAAVDSSYLHRSIASGLKARSTTTL